MSTTTATRISDIPPLIRPESLDLARAEYTRMLDLLAGLAPAAWAAATDCPGWDVRHMVAHVLGAAEAHGSLREFAHQMRLGRRGTGPLVNGLSAVQVSERDHLTPSELLDRFQRAAPRSVSARRRVPRIVRALPIKDDSTDPPERWRLGYLLDIIYTRDCWMHRVDICRATGTELVLSAGHDGRIIADVVADWARRHRKAFTLNLTGPAGGAYTSGGTTTPQAHTLDAVQFCRILSGRDDPSARQGLLAHWVPF